MTLKDKIARPLGAQYATGDQWRTNSRKNEGTEPKQKQHPVVDVTGDQIKVQCYKEQYCMGFPGGSDGKASACNVGDTGSISGSGRSPGKRKGYPLQYSYLENSMDRGAWRTTVHGVAKSWTTEQHFPFCC